MNCPVLSLMTRVFVHCPGDLCGWYHKEKRRCAILSMAIGLTYDEPAKMMEEDDASVDLPQEIMDKLKKAGVRSVADIGKMGGIAALLGQGVITKDEANEMAEAFKRWNEFVAAKSSTPGEPGKS